MKTPNKISCKSSSIATATAVLAACASPLQAVSLADTKALSMALEDEYRAEATYNAVLGSFPGARPFINIIEAERRHADRVKAEMDRVGITYAKTNPYLGTFKAPASVLEACQQGIVAEEENIALYDRVLPSVTDGQIRETLTALQSASRERHLPAFQRCVARGGAMGAGRGRAE
jgi:rubrerythrin